MNVKKINFTAAVNNIRKNFGLLFSALAALCLFLSPSVVSLLLATSFFCIVVAAVALDVTAPGKTFPHFTKPVSILFAFAIACLGFDRFIITWVSFNKVTMLANVLGLTTPVFLRIIGTIGCIVGFYSIYSLSIQIVAWIIRLPISSKIIFWLSNLLNNLLPVQEKTKIIANLKKNWYFPISALFFFALTGDSKSGYLAGLLIAFTIAAGTATQIPSIWDLVNQYTGTCKLLCFFTAAGICLGNQTHFYKEALKRILRNGLPEILNTVFLAISYLGAACGIFFVFFCLLIFWKKMQKILTAVKLIENISRKEWAAYALILTVSLVFMTFSFTKSQAFYETQYLYDVIYTSDSPSMVVENVYLELRHSENDLRQPLFAVFAAPFTGIPYLLARILGTSSSIRAVLINSVQIFMLLTANFMLAKMLKLGSAKRICFMILSSCSYSYLLFSLMMEQYLVAYFWLIFCMYLITEKQQPDSMVLSGAGGTLLTSMILLPFFFGKSPIKNFKAWCMDIAKYCLEFIGLMLAFCRFDVIWNLISRISFLSRYTGKSVSFSVKIYQYTEFVKSCFFAPDASINTTAVDHISWQLNTADNINWGGILILVLTISSAVWNRDKKSSQLAVLWIGFSFVMLLGLGWGTQENGLILYALYFGWAFFVLLFQLVEKIENTLKLQCLLPLFTVCSAAAMLIVNIPAIAEMVNFAITHYPA